MSAHDMEKGAVVDVETKASSLEPEVPVVEEAPREVVDTNTVDFDGPDDPENPLNWSPRYKWVMVIVLSLMNLMVNLGTIIVAPAAPSILSEFHKHTGIYSTILVSIWELGEIIGPLIIAPLSELYGRLAIYHVANVFFIIFSVAGAVSVNINMLIAFRCLSGLTVASTTLNSGTVGDMFRQEERGTVMTTITEVFEGQYHISQGPVGLVFLGIGIGMGAAVIFCSATLDKIIKRTAAAAGGEMKPEYRLPPMLLGGISMPIGLFLYGWTADKRVQFVVPIIGTAFVSFGLMITTIPCTTYLVDAFSIHAASAIAAFIVLRNIMATVLPLAGPSLYSKLGYGWGNSVLGFIALGFVPVTLLLMKYGERIRTNDRFKVAF